VTLEIGQVLVEDPQARDPVRDLGSPPRDERRQRPVGLGAVAGVAPGGDPSRIVERDLEAPEVDQEPKVLEIRLCVLAVVVLAPSGTRQPARALVEANGVRRDPDPAGELPDPHAGSKPWSFSNVKP